MRLGNRSLVLAAGFLAFGALTVRADDPAPTTLKLFGSTKLTPPAEAEDQDATGTARFLQWGDRLAIHVHIRHLEPGAVYEVLAARKNTEGQDESASLGTITTRNGTPPPPHCFRSHLKVVEEPPPPAGGSLFHMGDHQGWPSGTVPVGGFAVLLLNQDGTVLNYDLNVWGKVTAASIAFGTGDPVPLTLDEKLRGSLTIDADQLAALADGKAVIAATATVKDADGNEKTVELSGEVKLCFPWLEELRERIAAHLSGTGALRLDTKRGDKMPFDVTDLRTLAGATISVKDAGGKVVLSGVVGELKVFPAPPAPAAGGGAFTPEDEVMSAAGLDLFFDVSEVHDASFIRGNANDDDRFDLSDAVFILDYLFLDGPAPYCADAADANDSGFVDISDTIYMLYSLYGGEGPLPAPFPGKGFDRSADGLFCGQGN